MRPFFLIPSFSLFSSKLSRLIWTILISLGSIHMAWAEGGGGGGDLGDGGGSGPEPGQGWLMIFGIVVLMGIGLYTRSRKQGHQ